MTLVTNAPAGLMVCPDVTDPFDGTAGNSLDRNTDSKRHSHSNI
jgi:hypothetical protein